MNKQLASLGILVMVFAGSCIFSMNDDYQKIPTGGNVGEGELTISGVLIDRTNNPATDITVNLAGAAVLDTKTNSSGEFTFEKVANGSYVVSPATGGYTVMPVTINERDKFIGTVKPGGHGASKNQDYSCAQCH